MNPFELALVEQHAINRRNRAVGLRGLGELDMGTQHVLLASGSFAAGMVVMHLLHRYGVMK